MSKKENSKVVLQADRFLLVRATMLKEKLKTTEIYANDRGEFFTHKELVLASVDNNEERILIF